MIDTMQEQWVEYDINTGKIEAILIAAFDIIEYQHESKWFVRFEGDVSETTHYVNLVNFQVELRQDYSIENIPAPCGVYIDDTFYDAQTRPDIKFEVDGQYKILIVPEAVMYQSKTFKVSQDNGQLTVISESV